MWKKGCFASALAIALTTAALGQTDANRGGINGQVTNQQGLAVPEARVLAIQLSSGLERETRTDESGLFQITSVLPGPYELRIESGSVAAIVRDITIRVGASLRVNVTLGGQATPETIDASASVLSVADAEMTQVIPFEAIRDLPINGRRFQEFATLTPAVFAGPETLGQLSFAGQRGVNSNVLIDGTDYNEPFLGGFRGGDRSTVAFTIPQSAIQEFQTVTSGYSAEYGRSTGGVLNAITRSGSNELHGEAFYLGRNSALSATTPHGLENLEVQQQFGGAAGGRIVRDRLFFFGAAEQQFARYPREVRFGLLDAVQRTAEVAPAYDYLRSQEGSFEQTNDATAVLGRGDYIFGGGAHALAGRYQYSRNNAVNASVMGGTLHPITNRALSSNGTEWDTIRSFGGQLTSVFRPSLLNDFRAQHSFEHRRRIPNLRATLVDAGALGTFGTPPLLPARLRDRRLQFANATTLLSGGHALKFGFDYSYIDFYQWYGDNQTGAFTIANADAASVLRILSGVSGNRFDDPSVIYRRQVGVLALEDAAHQLAFFVQDTWRATASVTLNFGLRWEGQMNPSPRVDNEFLLNSVRDFPFPMGRVDPTVIPNHLNQWAPRFGVAWNPGRGNTVFRAHTGIFYAQTPFILYAAPLDSFSSTPSDISLEIAPGNRGTVYQQFAAAGFNLNTTGLNELPIFTVPDVWMKVAGGPNPYAGSNVTTTSGNNFRNPRSVQIAIGAEHQFSRGITIDYQLNHINTVHLVQNIDYNVPEPYVRPGDLSMRPFFGLRSGTPRPNPNLGRVLVRDSRARALYTGNTFRVQLTRSRYDVAANYTLGFNKSSDDSERALSSLTYQNPFNLQREYHWSALDARHTVSGYVLYRAPWGLEITSLFRYRSGTPIDATTGGDTSELLTGADGNRPLERPGLPMLRNSFRNRDYKTVDFRVLKSIAVHERLRVQLSAELFNAFNIDNVRFQPNSVLPDNPAFRHGLGILPNGQTAPVDPGFLRLRTASGAYDPVTTGQQGGPFQAQLGVRLLF